MLNLFAYAWFALRGGFIFVLSLLLVGRMPMSPRDHTFDIECLAERYTARAHILTDSIERNFFNRHIPMLNNNSANRFTPSGCWDVAALLTMYTQMARLDGRATGNPFVARADRVLYMLGFYGHHELFNGFGIYTGSWSMLRYNISDYYIYYDDNMWIGRDLVKLYNLTGTQRYLDHAIAIADFLIQEAWQELCSDEFEERFGWGPGGPIGGFYWRDDRVSLHMCSNGPAVQYFVMLANALGQDDPRSKVYMEYAIQSYRFLRAMERPNGVFFDLINLRRDAEGNVIGIGNPWGPSWSYNSGTPISAAIELYQVTGEQHFLDDAIRWGRAAHAYFPRAVEGTDVLTFVDLPWFREILLMGYTDLYPHYPGARAFIETFEAAINFGYEHHRLRGVLGFHRNIIARNWVYGFYTDRDFDPTVTATALEQIPHAGIYAALAMFYREPALCPCHQ